MSCRGVPLTDYRHGASKPTAEESPMLASVVPAAVAVMSPGNGQA